MSRTSRHPVFSPYRACSFQSERTRDDASTATIEVSIGYNEDPVKETKCDVSSGVMIRLVICLQTPQIKKSRYF